MKKNLSIIFIITLIPFKGLAQSADTTNKCCWNNNSIKMLSLEKLGSEFRQMKKHRGSHCCESYGSRMMAVMKVITDSVNTFAINKNPLSVDRLKELMGDADKIEDKTDEKIGNYRQFIYDWRFGHDYLVFTIFDTKVNGGFWYHAGD